MSYDRRRRSHEYYSPEPIILERSPRERTYRTIRPRSPERERPTFGSKVHNLFRARKKKVYITEEAPVRRRYQDRRIRTPSPSPSPSYSPSPPPSPPRGPYRVMSSGMEHTVYTPLPPVLPFRPKPPKHHDTRHYDVEERVPRYRKVRVIHGHPEDVDAYPRVESPPPRPKRDSGKHYLSDDHVEAGPSRTPKEYVRRRPDPEVQHLVDSVARERRDRHEAERAAALAEDKALRLQADLEREKRQREYERQRERELADRAKRLSRERDQLLEVRRPHERHGVVVVHNPGPVVATRAPDRSALERAQDDYRRAQRNGVALRDDRRPATSDGLHRGQHVIIVGDSRRRDHDRRR